MPRVTFDTKNKSAGGINFPKLKLDSQDRARILCIEQDPHFEWVHTLRAPKIVNGRAEMKTVVKPDGQQTTEYDMDFIGRPLCLGDHGILQETGVDPKNCPACRFSVEHGDMLRGPERRFAMHVIRYAVKQGTFEVATPFNVSCVVWSFPDSIFDKLVDFVEQWGDLRQHDLLLGPCTNVTFQKFDIHVAPNAGWLASKEVQGQTVETYKANQCPDLAQLCGRKVDRRFMEEDLDKVLHRHNVAFGMPAVSPQVAEAEKAALQTGLDELLKSTPGATAPTPSEVPAGASLDDLLKAAPQPAPVSLAPAPAPEAPVVEAPPQPAPEPVAASTPDTQPPAQPSTIVDVADLLADVPTQAPAPSVPAVEAPAPSAPPEGEKLSFDALLAKLEPSK